MSASSGGVLLQLTGGRQVADALLLAGVLQLGRGALTFAAVPSRVWLALFIACIWRL